MAIDRANEPRAFLAFLNEPLARGGASLTLDECLARWEYENQTDEEREDTLRAIREGLADVEAGRTPPAAEVVAELRQKFGLSSPEELRTAKVPPEVQARIDELADKCTEGELTPEERAEYDAYVEAIDVLSIVLARSRRRSK